MARCGSPSIGRPIRINGHRRLTNDFGFSAKGYQTATVSETASLANQPHRELSWPRPDTAAAVAGVLLVEKFRLEASVTEAPYKRASVRQ